ncbi:hypothetical protein F5888DRAFT_1805562 [Russula emetica]|nr:hypothetical protein F5888DRAFT_1805562 [Russula emetica]
MSYRNDANATYDHTLLSSVPGPTKAERQEGYNVDLLDEGRDRRVPSPPVPNRLPTDQQPLTDGYSPGAVALLAHKEGQLENGVGPTVAKGQWYRTRWGITAIVIVIVLIIGGIVGGVVGGTHHSSHKSNNGNGEVGGGGPSANNGTSSIGSGGAGASGGGGGSSSPSSTSADSRGSATPSSLNSQGTLISQAAPSNSLS